MSEEIKEARREVNQLRMALAGVIEILEGESGAGSNFWEQDWRYLQAKRALDKTRGEK